MPRVTTIPSTNARRNLAGRVRRFLSSIVCSYSPRSMRASWFEPTTWLPLCPTIPHLSTLRNHLLPVRPTPGQRGRPPLGREGERVRALAAFRERVGQRRGEGVARSVGVLDRPRRGHGAERPAGLRPASERACRGDDEPRRRIEVARLVPLALVLAARHERVQLDARPLERRQLARGRHEHTTAAAQRPERGLVAAGEVDAVGAVELLPGQVVLDAGRELLADDGDRPLAERVDMDEGDPLRPVPPGGADGDAEPLELALRPAAEVVLAERREEQRLPVEAGELRGRDRAPPPRLPPPVRRVPELPRARKIPHP